MFYLHLLSDKNFCGLFELFQHKFCCKKKRQEKPFSEMICPWWRICIGTKSWSHSPNVAKLLSTSIGKDCFFAFERSVLQVPVVSEASLYLKNIFKVLNNTFVFTTRLYLSIWKVNIYSLFLEILDNNTGRSVVTRLGSLFQIFF